MDAPAIIPLTPKGVPAAAAVLARAFHDDPLFTFLAHDEQRRSRFLSKCMTAFARYAQPLDESYVTGGELLGVSLWLPPSEYGRVRRIDMLRAGIVGAMWTLGLSGSRLFAAAGNAIESAHEHTMEEREHWYLMDIGVEPDRQSTGIGSALIAPVLAHADAEGIACYLETQNPRAVAFYRKHGFAVVRELDLPLDGPHLWTFVREANMSGQPA